MRRTAEKSSRIEAQLKARCTARPPAMIAGGVTMHGAGRMARRSEGAALAYARGVTERA